MRGDVYSFQTGSCVSDDRDLGSGWKHVAAVRRGRQLKLFVDGEMVATTINSGSPLDLSCDAPLRIGFGPQGYFDGKIREVRVYDRSLSDELVKTLANNAHGKTALREASAK